MTWIGAPTIYFGDEAGQTQTTYENSKVDPGNRRTIPWDHSDTSLTDWYRQWIAVRHANPVLETGGETTLLTDDAHRVFAFLRRDGSQVAVVVLNADRSDKPHTVTLSLPNVPGSAQLTDAATHERISLTGGKLTLSVDGQSERVLLSNPG
jgi:alpha-glucosidase